ncbi:alginate export family protein [Stieleria marina]|uniref:alginate export family protein n=1 Tax=Stieleria marina TaxID=1930275 RepID=UPI003AF3F791
MAASFSGSHLFADQPITELSVGQLPSDTSVQQVVLQEAVDVAAESVAAEAGIPQPISDATPVAVEAEAVQAAPAPPPAYYQNNPVNAVVTAAPSCNCCTTKCCTKKKKEAATAAMKAAYGGLFYGNNFSYLNDPCYDGPSFLGDSLKGLAGGKLDIGGEARVRYHSENNIRARVPGLRGTGPSGLGLTNNDDEFFLTRVRLFANYRMTDNIRVYGEYLYADSGGEDFGNRPIEENRGEIQNLFIDAKLTDNLTARVGRQELLYGSQRLISPLDWANTRRTFDGARGLYSNGDFSLDGFFVHPVNRNTATESKIDDADENQDFYGVYGSQKGLGIGNVDAYYLGYENQTVDFSYHTIGSRVYGKTDGGMLYETEGGFQFGDNAPGLGSHSANFFTAGLGRQLEIGDWKPTVWMWYDTASGEKDFADVNRGDDGFDHLQPLAHKVLGFMDLFGRRNIQDINMQFITPVMGPKVKLLLWYHYLRLNEATTPYDVVLQPYNTNTAAGDKELGHEIDVLFNINLNPRNNVLLGYSHFAAGDYYDTTAGVPNNDADFFYAQFQTRF